MRILFYIDTLHGGGAAKKVCILANEFTRQGHLVAIATNLKITSLYSISDEVQMFSMSKNTASRSKICYWCNKLSGERAVVKTFNPDVIVTCPFHVSFYTKIALLGIKVPIVFSDDTSFARKGSVLSKYIRFHFYKYGDALVILSNNDRKILGKRFKNKIVIHNPVILEPHERRDYSGREKSVVVIGQTQRWYIKGLDIAIDAFSKVTPNHPEWTLKIVGETEPKTLKYLMGIISEKKVDGKVCFLGYKKDIENILGQTSIFMLTSRFEGFSLSLVESLSEGTPAVCFSECGVIEEVSDGLKGTIVVPDGDVERLAEQLNTLMSDDNLRIKLSGEGIGIEQLYNKERIASQWLALFSKLIKDKN